jgi:hypothetical protein
MKTINIYLLATLLLLGFNLPTQAQKSKKEAREEARNKQFQETLAMVEAGAFRFDAKRAHPQGYRSVDLTTNPGFLKISNDSVQADLPFFGRGYTAHYGNESGMKFKGTIENKKVDVNEKKRRIRYSFTVRDKDNYQVTLEIHYGGSSSLNISSNNKSSISYDGDVSNEANAKE